MRGWSLDIGMASAVLAIVLGTVAGIVAAIPAQPWWATPIVAGITALAVLVRRAAGPPYDE